MKYLLILALLAGCTLDCDPKVQFPSVGFGCQNMTVASCDPRATVVQLPHGIRCVCPVALPAAATE